MAIAHAPKLLTDAQSGIKLKTSERRLVIQYLMATQPDTTNVQMAEWFGVTERTIRLDKNAIRGQKAKFLKDELSKDIALVIADIAMDFEQQKLDIEKSKQKCKLGSKPYVDHCNAIFDMRLKMVKAFQDIGYLPKNLGNLTTTKFEYKAIVNKDGSAVTRPVDLFDPEKEKREALDAEFVDVPPPALAAPANEQDENAGSSVPEEVPGDARAGEPDSGESGASTSTP